MPDTTPPMLRERAPSRIDEFTNSTKLDVRAHQRTYEGAYTRSAVGCLSFSIVIIKLFSKEFLPIGVIYTLYGSILYFLGVYKVSRVTFFYNPDKDAMMFKTRGNYVLFLTLISLCSYISLLVLLLRL